MNKTIRLNKRTLIIFDFPYIRYSKNHISIELTTAFFIQFINYNDRNIKYNFKSVNFNKNLDKLNNFYELDFELNILGFGIRIETIFNKNKVDNVLYFAKLKQLTTKKSHES